MTKVPSPIDSLLVNPNPFVDSAFINLYLAANDTISLTIFDTNMVKVAALIKDERMFKGSYSLPFCNSLPNGLYLVQLTIGNIKILSYQVVEERPASILNTALIKDIVVFPNPSEGLLHIILPEMAITSQKLIVFDHSGRQVFASMFGINQQSFDLSHLAPGIYIISVQCLGYYIKWSIVR